jgi:hypothetical protein
MEGAMSIFDMFRKPAPAIENEVLKQILHDQRIMLSKIEQLTQQIESLKQPAVRTSISTPIKTIIAPYEDPQATHILQFLQQRRRRNKLLNWLHCRRSRRWRRPSALRRHSGTTPGD